MSITDTVEEVVNKADTKTLVSKLVAAFTIIAIGAIISYVGYSYTELKKEVASHLDKDSVQQMIDLSVTRNSLNSDYFQERQLILASLKRTEENEKENAKAFDALQLQMGLLTQEVQNLNKTLQESKK